MSNSFCSETLAETGEGPAQFPQTQKQVAWPTAVLNQLESQGEKLKLVTFFITDFSISVVAQVNQMRICACPVRASVELSLLVELLVSATKSPDLFCCATLAETGKGPTQSPPRSGLANCPGSTLDQSESQSGKVSVLSTPPPLGDVHFDFSVRIALPFKPCYFGLL